VLSHHELRTLADKELDGFWEPPPAGAWLVEQRLLPDLWVNGHAHSLQLGVYDARATDDGRVSPSEGDQPWLIPALTTGAGSKVRPGPSCSDHPASPGGEHQIVADRKVCKEQPARGMPRFSRSALGYAVVRLGPWHLQVEIKDQNGELLYCWVRGKGDPGGATCPLDGVFEDQPEGGMQGRGAGALGGLRHRRHDRRGRRGLGAKARGHRAGNKGRTRWDIMTPCVMATHRRRVTRPPW
jgi:hypothetical protein